MSSHILCYLSFYRATETKLGHKERVGHQNNQAGRRGNTGGNPHRPLS